jgi:two-component system response regulator FixJ
MTDTASLPNSSKHVFLIDDDVSIRSSLTGLLEFIGYQVYAFPSAKEFLKVPLQVAPAVVITDMRMPDMTGIELQAELIKRGREVPIIFISGESTITQSISAMKQGAIDFLIKPFERDALLEAVIRALNMDAINLRKHIKKMTLDESLKFLAPREREIFELLALGLNNAEIQEKLHISLHTTKQYKAQVMRKLNLRSLAQLIALKTSTL